MDSPSGSRRESQDPPVHETHMNRGVTAPRMRARLDHDLPDDASSTDQRRGRFIPAPSRAAVDELASDIRRLRLRRRGSATYPAWGRVDAALHALLGLIPYPDDPEERELLDDTLRCLMLRAPDVALALAERMQAHHRAAAASGQGASREASAGVE